MGKSVFSLVLTDEIVLAIDRLAAEKGYSRSGLIDHILADYASLATPEHKNRCIIEQIERSATGRGFRCTVTPGMSIAIKTNLQYKYNPTMCYTVELGADDRTMGELRVFLRSQNETLLEYFRIFFELWHHLEVKHLQTSDEERRHRMQEKRYRRKLRRLEPEVDETTAGKAVAAYVGLLDACMRDFVDNLDDAPRAVAKIEKRYLDGIGASGYIAEL